MLKPFLIVALCKSGTRNALLGPLLDNTEDYWTPLLVLQITLLQDKIINNQDVRTYLHKMHAKIQ
jgi:hypothetical protein